MGNNMVKRWVLQAWRWVELLNPFGRPLLEGVETHITDHCNMNCRGCSHFSPLCDPWFATPDAVMRDMKSLARLFRGVRTVRLLGGEPLLHPQIRDFLIGARHVFPKARIHLITNGLVLKKMSMSFWETCRETGVELRMTVYPPMQSSVDECKILCKKNGVPLVLTPSDHFFVWLDRLGQMDIQESFKQCRKMIYCPIVKEGKLFTCAASAYISALNRHAGLHLPEAAGLALDDERLTGRQVLKWLNQPLALCRYCAINKELVPWKNGQPEIDDWFVGGDSGVAPMSPKVASFNDQQKPK